MTTYAIALGSNRGDRAQHLRVAVEEIGALGDVSAVSGLYETAPVGGPEQGPYLNAVVVVSSNLAPHRMLGRLQAIEKARGRERTVHWGARTLDLDIIATDDETVDTADLQIPHPRASERRFVLEPLSEVWPEAVVADGVTAAEARDLVADQEVDLLLPTWVGLGGEQGRWWVAAQLMLLLAITVGIIYDGSLPDDTAAPVRIAGGLVLLVGAALVLAAARSLGGALTIMPEPVPDSTLVERGVYAHSRHPMYGGVTLMMLGVSLLLASVAGVVSSIALFLFFWAKSGYEERRLRIAYPWYGAYRRRVRHRMLPYLL